MGGGGIGLESGMRIANVYDIINGIGFVPTSVPPHPGMAPWAFADGFGKYVLAADGCDADMLARSAALDCARIAGLSPAGDVEALPCACADGGRLVFPCTDADGRERAVVVASGDGAPSSDDGAISVRLSTYVGAKAMVDCDVAGGGDWDDDESIAPDDVMLLTLCEGGAEDAWATPDGRYALLYALAMEDSLWIGESRRAKNRAWRRASHDAGSGLYALACEFDRTHGQPSCSVAFAGIYSLYCGDLDSAEAYDGSPFAPVDVFARAWEVYAASHGLGRGTVSAIGEYEGDASYRPFFEYGMLGDVARYFERDLRVALPFDNGADGAA